jgi:uncharacterized protein (DUF924 family)
MRIRSQLFLYKVNQNRINLKTDHPSGALQKRLGEKSLSNADFHHHILARKVRLLNNSISDAPINEEMLSPSPATPTPQDHTASVDS